MIRVAAQFLRRACSEFQNLLFVAPGREGASLQTPHFASFGNEKYVRPLPDHDEPKQIARPFKADDEN